MGDIGEVTGQAVDLPLKTMIVPPAACGRVGAGMLSYRLDPPRLSCSEILMLERGRLSRRGFLQRSLAAGMATGLPAWYAREILAAQEEKGQRQGGRRQRPHRHGRHRHRQPAEPRPGHRQRRPASDKGVQLRRRLRRGHETPAKTPSSSSGPTAKGYEDFRELLDRKDINAVTIATPDHWHALIAIDAMRKGKDVYCEKPLTLTVAGRARLLAKVAKETGRIFQTGSQQRSGRAASAWPASWSATAASARSRPSRPASAPTRSRRPVQGRRAARRT